MALRSGWGPQSHVTNGLLAHVQLTGGPQPALGPLPHSGMHSGAGVHNSQQKPHVGP